MTKEIKDMTQEELKIICRKNTELFQLAKKIDEETDFDILVFSLIELLQKMIHHHLTLSTVVLSGLLTY